VHLAGPGGPEPGPGQPTGVTVAVDVDDVYLPYLRRFGSTALLVRPDYYVFGAVNGRDPAAVLVDDLRSQLGAGAPVG
jgi:flavoprotein hydroxylase